MGQKQAIPLGTDVQKLVDEYFGICKASRQEWKLKNGDIRVRQTIPSLVGLAYHLGIGKSTLTDYMDGRYSNHDNNPNAVVSQEMREYTEYISAVLTRARDRIEVETLDAASRGDIDGKIAALRLGKHGYSAKVEAETKSDITVTWQGVNTADIDDWGG